MKKIPQGTNMRNKMTAVVHNVSFSSSNSTMMASRQLGGKSPIGFPSWYWSLHRQADTKNHDFIC